MIEMIYKIYLLLNIGIIINYIFSKISLQLLYSQCSQSKKLHYVRNNFLFIIFALAIFLWMFNFLQAFFQSNFQFKPILKSSVSMLQNTEVLQHTFMQHLNATKQFEIKYIVYGMFLIGLLFNLLRYLQNIFLLNKLKKQSIVIRKISMINILVSDEILIPFCWSFLKTHYIIIPNFYLEKNRDLSIAIRHELQHVRQGDTQWTHLFAILKIFHFYNPFLYFFHKMNNELQEFACDEALILSNKTLPVDYAECLFDSAKISAENKIMTEITVGINILPKSILYRRISMMFQYKMLKRTKSFIVGYLISFIFAISTSYAFHGYTKNVSLDDVNQLISKSAIDTRMNIVATPLVVSTLNNILHDPNAVKNMKAALKRMAAYQPTIDEALQKNNIPNEFIALPFIESQFLPLKQEQNAMHAAGIWQIIPSTGQHLGLTINSRQDDRMDTTLSTNAAIKYLKQNYKYFQDWKLALIAYEIGEINTAQLLKKTKATDAASLLQSSHTPGNIKQFVATFDAAILIIHHPSLLN